MIARNTAFSFKGKTVDIRQIGRELGVRYVLEGSIRKAGQRVRVTARFSDSESGAHLWVDRFDRAYPTCFNCKTRSPSSLHEYWAYSLSK